VNEPLPTDDVISIDGRQFSRRLFIAGSAAAMVPFALGHGAFGATQERTVLKVGLIGCGGRGTGAAMQAISAENGTVVLHAMGDVFLDRAESALANLKEAAGEEGAARIQVTPERMFSGFDAYEKVLASGVDVVLLTTPPYFRPTHLRAAIAAGKHVFCEKPVAVDAPGVRSVLESAKLAKEKNLAIVCGFCWRYNNRHRALWERVHSGAIGDVRAYYSTYNASPLGTRKRDPKWSEMEFQLRNWQHFTWLSGDHIVEQAVHSIDKQGWTFGDAPPLAVVAVGGRQARVGEERGDVYDHFSATYEYANGARAFHMCRQIDNCANDNSDWIWGTKGDALVNGWQPLHRITGANAWDYEGPDNDMYQQEHDELFASIRAGTPKNDGEWVAHSTLLAIMARMAAYTGQQVSWQQALESTETLGPRELTLGDAPKVVVPVPGITKLS
jgi:myo-inositol 2-dehydrogenase/D-chiro-inositol 1-dehydrogenase